jgi:3-isopropylmalate/(R)-2-methylmalate dehydratase large subunit
MGMTVVEKILARAAGLPSVKVGDVVEPAVDLAMSHENAALVINQFMEIHKGTGLDPRVWDPERVAIIFDHRVPAESPKTATNQKKVREFVGKQGITKFHDIRGDRGGICHQVGIGATEMACVWALGKALNVEVPPTIKVVVEGEFPLFVGPKDLILHFIGRISAEGASFRVIEFHGETIRHMETSGRLVLCNMSVEAGATAGIVPADAETVRYLREEAGVDEALVLVSPDVDAVYDQTITIDVSELEPQIACPHTVDNVHPVHDVRGRRINQIVIGSCTNGRVDDLEAAAEIIRGHTIAPNVRMLVFPASARVYREALDRGYIGDFVQAGALVMNPGCGPCLGVHEGALGDGEVALSTTNRNFKGRMGNPASEVYLCSPEVAAASALTGVITDPRKE